MSYHEARECFKENNQLFISPDTDPKGWNANNGLLNLVDAVESDLSQIQSLLGQILQELQRQR